MQIIFHIGLHKTASTFLQQEVFPRLDPEKVNYLGKCPDAYRQIIYQDEAFFDAGAERRGFDSLLEKEKINLISDEVLAGDPQNGGIPRSRILAKMKDCFPDARIILFIRRQDSYALSCYKGSIRNGGNLSVPAFFKPVLHPELAYRERRYPNPTREMFLHHAYIKFLLGTFGAENVLVLPFEMLRTDRGAALEQLCGFIGVPVPDYRDSTRNISWGSNRIAWHRLINLFLKGQQNPYGCIRGVPYYSRKTHRFHWMTLRAMLARMDLLDRYELFLSRFDRPFQDRTATTRRILELCREDNRRIEVDFGIELGKYGYY